ncbi:hypothetical protein FDA33_10405 [Clostridium botulinum]|uniref:Uncharacterized protein n=1 Tax=Clostridium botulinum TaxID=1491 RepID=A0A846K5N8_CLOBO|nr:hypothetical protein [Clostridium botulinum]ALT05279.1 hypothetical protein [Clostridium botulinum]KOR55635.1 hypothetical protein ADT22_15485 [Clostridium botulinum]NFH90602.1 hypothetical protein [Clostridium botulinum]NFI19128.1 hypothetical protein [Clostridium botulinum]NFN06387.1 hypothetical protein [Clostridium botulinum]
MKSIIKNNKFIFMMLCIIVLAFVSIIGYYTNKIEKLKSIEISRLTTEYNKENKNNETFKETTKRIKTNDINIKTNTKVVTDNFDINNDKVIEKLIIDMTTLINNDEFTRLYKEYYNEEYVKEFKITEKQVIDKFKFSQKVSASITRVTRESDVYDRAVATVRLIDDKKAERIFDITVFEDGKIADLPLYKEVRFDRTIERDNVLYTVKKRYKTRLGSIFIVNVVNNSEYLVDIQEIKAYMGTSFKYDHELINGNIHTYEVTPEESQDFIIKIFNQDKPDDLRFTNKKIDGTIEEFSVLNNR